MWSVLFKVPLLLLRDGIMHNYVYIAPNFSHEEIAKFERRLEEGYNLKSDKRYNAWLSKLCQSAIALHT